MTSVFELRNVTKRFGKKVALENVSLSVNSPSIIGLIGRNGSGKTTLLRHVTGFYLPTSGTCTTLGCDTGNLSANELSRIGLMNQHDTFIGWMKVSRFLSYVASFYPRWDNDLQAELVKSLEIDPDARVETLSPGNAQKVGLVISTCHHPKILLLDEPLSDLDPIIRMRAVSMLLERFTDGSLTMVISSHLLHDIERIVDRIVCLERGRVLADASFDDLREQYGEWIVTSPSGSLPPSFTEPFVLSSDGDRFQTRLEVNASERIASEFGARHNAEVQVRPMSLEQLFRAIVRDKTSLAAPNSEVAAVEI